MLRTPQSMSVECPLCGLVFRLADADGMTVVEYSVPDCQALCAMGADSPAACPNAQPVLLMLGMPASCDPAAFPDSK